MKCKIFSYFFYLIILITLHKLSYSLITTSPVYPVNKILLTDNLSRLYFENNIRCDLESIGYGVTFNISSNISLIPYNLFHSIRLFYKGFEDLIVQTKNKENGITELIVWANLDFGFETIHFIFEKFGISIPLKYYFVEKEIQKYGLIFLTKEDQEYISFGKDLLDVMDVEIIDDNNFIVHNDEFISKMDD